MARSFQCSLVKSLGLVELRRTLASSHAFLLDSSAQGLLSSAVRPRHDSPILSSSHEFSRVYFSVPLENKYINKVSYHSSGCSAKRNFSALG